MSFYISICTDLNALIATGLVDEESLLRGMIEGRSGNYVCHNLPVDPTESMIIISSLEGLEEIEALDYITITTPEVVFGYKEQETDEDGNLLWGPYYWVQPPSYTVTTDHWVDTGRVDENGFLIYENEPTTETITPPPYETRDPITQDVPPDAAMRALYDSIYDQSPVPDPEDPTAPPVVPSQFFALPSGYDSSHLLNT
jgi:hypothetical protein